MPGRSIRCDECDGHGRVYVRLPTPSNEGAPREGTATCEFCIAGAKRWWDCSGPCDGRFDTDDKLPVNVEVNPSKMLCFDCAAGEALKPGGEVDMAALLTNSRTASALIKRYTRYRDEHQFVSQCIVVRTVLAQIEALASALGVKVQS